MTDAIRRRQSFGSIPASLASFFSSIHSSQSSSSSSSTTSQTTTSDASTASTTSSDASATDASTTGDQSTTASIPLTTATSVDLDTSASTSATVINPTPTAQDASSSSPTVSPTASSLPALSPSGTTFQTSTSASFDPDSSTATGSADGSASSPFPDFQQTRHHHDGLSGGALAAAVLIPVLIALSLLIALAFFCLRRRRKYQPAGQTPSAAMADFVPTMREKMGARPRSTATAPGEMPIVTSETNNSYFTGLDTSSRGSQEFYAPARRSEGGTFAEPPPPYKADKSLRSATSGTSLTNPAAHTLATLPPIDISPFNDPESPVASLRSEPGAASGLLGVNPRPASARSGTSRSIRSITSTLYSDTASVHSAHAARLSVGGAAQVVPLRASLNGLQGLDTNGLRSVQDLSPARRSSDPFDDPESPVSSLGDEQRMLSAGMHTDRGISPVSAIRQ